MVPRGLDQSEQDHSLHLATLPIGVVTLKAPKDELPWWLSGKESACQCRRHRFDPSVQISWRGEWQSIPVLLPGESHGYRGLVGFSSSGRKRVGHNLLTKQQILAF